MALSNWIDRIDDIDDVMADDVNSIAHAVLAVENGTTQTTPKDGSVTAAKLAGGAVTTAKMANGNVTMDKLSADVKAAIQAGGSSGGTSSAQSVTLVVAASNSGAKAKAAADYTCTGSGDQSTINNAISALPSSGGKIVLLEGTYNCSGSIKVNKANVTLEGMGAGTVITSSVRTDIISVTGAYTTIQNLCIVGNSDYEGAGISAQQTSHVLVQDVLVKDCNAGTYSYGVNLTLADKSRVTNVHTINCRHGIHINSQYCIVTNCFVEDSTYRGINLERGNNIIADNYVLRGTGQSSDYTSSQYTIYINGGVTNNFVTDNYIPGKNYTNDGDGTNVFVNNIYDSGDLSSILPDGVIKELNNKIGLQFQLDSNLPEQLQDNIIYCTKYAQGIYSFYYDGGWQSYSGPTRGIENMLVGEAFTVFTM